jgi:hypothetical protein
VPGPPAAPPIVDWFESEPALGSAAGATTSRLVRRARASWRTWVAAAVVLAAAATIQRARKAPSYEVEVLLRVVEGTVEGPALSEAEIIAQVEDLAFTKERLLALMRRHPKAFPKAATDQSLALDDFQDRMKVEMFEDDFIEDRQPGDPPRSARIRLGFKAPDPELAWTMAHELQTLLVDSGLQRQRDVAHSTQEAAAKVVRGAELDLAAALQDSGGMRNKRVDAAQGRLLRAQQELAEASVGARASSARLALRFDVIDPGRRPSIPSRRAVLMEAFTTTLFLSLLAFSMLAGAYDPRVLNLDDLGRLGAPVLGRFPALSRARDTQAAGAEGD